MIKSQNNYILFAINYINYDYTNISYNYFSYIYIVVYFSVHSSV